MLLATSLNVLHDYTPDIPRAVKRLADAGFDALDFNGCDIMRPWRGPDGDRHVRILKAAADDHGLPFSQAHGPMFDYYSEKAAEDLADTRRCIEFCGLLGVPWMVMHPYSIAGSWTPAHRELVLETNLGFFRQFIPLMEEHGVGIAIENLSDFFRGTRYYGATPAELIELCDALDHELFGLCWDTGHALLQKLPQFDSLQALGPRLKAIHVQDNSGRNDDHLMPYHGRVPWDDVIRGLQAIDYQGTFTYEIASAVRPLPDELRDEALGLAVSIGRHLCSRIDAGMPATA